MGQRREILQDHCPKVEECLRRLQADLHPKRGQQQCQPGANWAASGAHYFPSTYTGGGERGFFGHIRKEPRAAPNLGFHGI
uniref:Uncharacterized protein n=1 Tax=Pyxicephalus adspersus TaxID=30357 RepID=A0AAV3ARF4_PYXAD|nr:TPA: hypothetical protein GDO54_008078 [Pyxicephalus adspersus]